ncbi:MAG: glycosyltransferase family 4 protein [Candidatus Binataceae bacterium]
MRIGFNARILSDRNLRGWNRYSVNLLEELSRLSVELLLYSDRPLYPSHLARLDRSNVRVVVSPPLRYIHWEQYWLPRQCKNDHVDVLHSPFSFGIPWFAPCPLVLTLHDAIDQIYYALRIHWSKKLTRAEIVSRLYRWLSRKSADQIITVSQHSKRDLVTRLRIPEQKITVIHEAAESHFYTAVAASRQREVRELYGLKEPYVLYVGGWEGRKNIGFLVRSFAKAGLLDTQLVLAGGSPQHRAEIGPLITSLGISDRVALLDWVDEALLPALYAGALCFVYPSEYEGFGLQLCEAMATGCPILASCSSSLPEVLDNGGDYFQLDDESGLTASLRHIHDDSGYRQDLKARARQRSTAFSWSDTAERTLSVYRRVLAA